MSDMARPWSVAAIAAWVALPHDLACTVLAAMGYDPSQQNIEPHRLRIALDALANDGARTFRRADSGVTITHCRRVDAFVAAGNGVRH